MNNIIGKKVIRVDGYEKVTGKAVYGDDIQLKGMLYAACRYTDIPAGKITKLDLFEAEKSSGVKAVAGFKDIPGAKRIGPIRQDHYPIVNDEVFYGGDVLAVAAAETQQQANDAVNKINAEYEPKEGIFDPVKALSKESRLIHPEFKSNVVVHYPLRKGNIEAGFAASDTVLEREYNTGFHEHAYIEPESVTAVPDPTTRGFKVYGSIQNPFTTRKVVAMFMGLNLNQVNVFGSIMGGSFGGKDDIINVMACRCALLSKLTDKPVKLTNTRENSLKESYKRHPYVMNYKVGFNKNGKLKAMKIDIVADSGAYSSQSFFVTWRSVVQATGPYEIENVNTDIRAVYTNNTYTAAFRGFGSPQVIFAQESLMDEIAEICGISPIEIRKLNGYKQGSITASGQKLSGHKVSLTQVMDEALAQSDYYKKLDEFQKINNENDRFKYGIGLACSFRGCSLGAEGTDVSSAIVSVQADGSVIVNTGVNENGQGLRTTFCQMTSEILGVEYQKVVFLEPQTSTISDGGPTVASRGTLMGGNAVIDAAEKVKDTIFQIIKDDLQADDIKQTQWKEGKIFGKNGTSISFAEAAEKAYWAGENLSAYGWSRSPEVSWDEESGQGNAYFTYVYGCHVAEIKQDTSTGKIDVLQVTAVHDVGKVINKIGIEGQVYGGVAQGIGYGILEDYNIEKGKVKSDNLDEYLIPTIKDIINIKPILIENEDQYGPFGAKSIGEPTLELTAAAINNSLSVINGTRNYRIPLTLEQVYLGKNLKKPTRGSEVNVKKARLQSLSLNNISAVSPKNLEEAINLAASGDFKILSGGTDLMIELRKSSEPHKLLNVFGLKELKNISETEAEVKIGSAVHFSNIINNNIVQKYFPMLISACSKIGSLQVRNRGTIAGNLVNAAPCADSFPPLIAYGASVVLTSSKGKRTFPVEEFIVKNYETVIRKDEILTEIIILKPTVDFKLSYFKLGRRNALNITRLSIGVLMSFNGQKIKNCIIVAGSLFQKPGRISQIEELLNGKELSDKLINSIEEPLKEIIESEIGGRWSSEYKIPVFINMCKDALNNLKQQVKI